MSEDNFTDLVMEGAHTVVAAVMINSLPGCNSFTGFLFTEAIKTRVQQLTELRPKWGTLFGQCFVLVTATVDDEERKPAQRALYSALDDFGWLKYCHVGYYDLSEGIWRVIYPRRPRLDFADFVNEAVHQENTRVIDAEQATLARLRAGPKPEAGEAQ